MSEFDKPPPYSPEAPPTTTQPIGYQGGAPYPYPPPTTILPRVCGGGGGPYPGAHPPPLPPARAYQVVNQGNLPAYGSTVYVQQPSPVSPRVILVGGCPACRVGVLEDDFTCLGVFLAIFFFPLGIICCLAMMQRRCPNCGAIFN